MKAKSRSGPDADRLFRECFEQYQWAIDRNPTMFEAFLNLGIAKQHYAYKRSEEAQRSLDQSCECFAKAARIRPMEDQVHFNWGVSLLVLGRMNPSTAKGYIANARRKFEKVLALEPRRADALVNVGNTFWYESMRCSGKRRQTLVERAKVNYLKAEDIEAGAGAFNLSCLYGTQGEAAQSAHWLAVAHQKGAQPLIQSRIDRDTDFDGVRASEEFQAAYRQLFGQP